MYIVCRSWEDLRLFGLANWRIDEMGFALEFGLECINRRLLGSQLCSNSVVIAFTHTATYMHSFDLWIKFNIMMLGQ